MEKSECQQEEADIFEYLIGENGSEFEHLSQQPINKLEEKKSACGKPKTPQRPASPSSWKHDSATIRGFAREFQGLGKRCSNMRDNEQAGEEPEVHKRKKA